VRRIDTLLAAINLLCVFRVSFTKKMLWRGRAGCLTSVLRVLGRARLSSAAVLAPQTPSSSGSSSNTYPTLVAEIRDMKDAGSSKVRRLRQAGRVPGVIYGLDEDQNVVKIMVTMDEKSILGEMRSKGKSFESTIYELHVKEGGEEAGAAVTGRTQKHIVTPRQLQVNPLTEKPMSLNFIKYWPGTRMRIPIEFVNADQSVDLRRGSFLITVNKFVECICDMEIPKSLVVDLTGTVKGDVLKLNHIVFPQGVKPSKNVPTDFVVGVVRSSRGGG